MAAKSNVAGNVTTYKDIPDEIWMEIFSLLAKQDYHIVSLVCRRFQEIIDSMKVIPDSILNITENNVKKIRAMIEEQSIGKLSFKNVQLENIESTEDIKFILKTIGRRINHLSIKKTAVYESLKGNLINITSLELYFDDILKSNIDHLNLCVFPLLEKLVFLNNALMGDEAKTLLSQLTGPKKIFNLKFFKLESSPAFESEIIKVLTIYGDNLETLNIIYSGRESSCWENGWSCLKKLKNLQLTSHLNLNKIIVIFDKLTKKNQLEVIQLDGSNNNCSLSEDLLAIIVGKWMDSLRSIELLNCGDITNGGLLELRKLSKLHVLKLSDCKEITNVGLLMGIAIEENLIMEELQISNLSKLDDFGLRIMASRLPNLRILNLNNMEKAVTNTSLRGIFCFQTRLRILSMNNCFEITDEGLIGYGNNPYSIKRLRRLEELSLQSCHNLTNRTLIEALHLPELRVLRLGNCHKITSKGIEKLVKNCPALEELELSSIVMVDDNALFVIGNGFKRLRKLVISNCDNLPEVVLDHITDVFNALQDPKTNTTFSTNCKLHLVM